MNGAKSSWVAATVVVLWLAAAGCGPGPSEGRPGEEAGVSVSETPEGGAGNGGATMVTASSASATPEGTVPQCSGPTIADPAFDVSDKRLLVGFAENVFVGRVVEELGAKAHASAGAGPSMPRTRFSVEVVENVKGRLDGTVTVEQDGAYLPERRCVALVNGDPLLEHGREYMLLTRRGGGQDGPHEVVAPGYGDVPVEEASDREALVRRFEKAAKNQRDPLTGP